MLGFGYQPNPSQAGRRQVRAGMHCTPPLHARPPPLRSSAEVGPARLHCCTEGRPGSGSDRAPTGGGESPATRLGSAQPWAGWGAAKCGTLCAKLGRGEASEHPGAARTGSRLRPPQVRARASFGRYTDPLGRSPRRRAWAVSCRLEAKPRVYCGCAASCGAASSIGARSSSRRHSAPAQVRSWSSRAASAATSAASAVSTTLSS